MDDSNGDIYVCNWFLFSVFFLDEEKFFMGVSFGKSGVAKTTEDEISKKITLLEEQMKTIEKQASNSLSSTVFDNALLAIYKPDKDGNARCPTGWRVWVGSEGKFLRSLSTDRELGDTQEYATALPRTPFNIITGGRHTHNITGNGANGSGGNASETLRRGNGDKASHPTMMQKVYKSPANIPTC